MDVVCFRQDGKWFGCAAAWIVELIPSAELQQSPGLPSFVDGVATYRERPLLAVRLRPLVWPATTDDRMLDPGGKVRVGESLLVLGLGKRLVGVASDRVACILEVSEEQVEARRAMYAASSVIETVLYHRDREITMLRTGHLVRLVDTALGKTGWPLFLQRAGSKALARG